MNRQIKPSRAGTARYVFSALMLCATGALVGAGFLGSGRSVFASKTLKKIPAAAALPADRFIRLAKLINPAVVNIYTTQKAVAGRAFSDPFFDFFHPPHYMYPPVQRSLGTGFIIDPEGLIITNTHVIDGADTIKVQLQNRKDTYSAQVRGKDKGTDVALLKIQVKEKLPTARLGKSSQLQVGEWVAAFGNPYGHGHTMTKGIISAINREISELNLFPFLQTDASINPGNSGGPLVNMQGEVVGINTAMRTHGISFAIPIDNVKVILKDLKTHGRIRRGFIGVQMGENFTRTKGAFIADVIPKTPAMKAGLRPGDIITQFNNREIKNYRDLIYAVAQVPIGQKVSVRVWRKGKKLNLTLSVREHTPPSSFAQRGAVPSSPPPGHKQKTVPFKLGLTLIQGTPHALRTFGLAPLNRSHPLITEVLPHSPAHTAGIKVKDIILKVNGKNTYSPGDVSRLLNHNKTNTLDILRYRSYSQSYVSIHFKIKAR